MANAFQGTVVITLTFKPTSILSTSALATTHFTALATTLGDLIKSHIPGGGALSVSVGAPSGVGTVQHFIPKGDRDHGD